MADLKNGNIERIIMSRPAIEAGEERLGFLPGDLSQKVDPYLRPLYDALNDILGNEQVQKYLERGTIEIAPLAYMRGRTLNRASIIIDAATAWATARYVFPVPAGPMQIFTVFSFRALA